MTERDEGPMSDGDIIAVWDETKPCDVCGDLCLHETVRFARALLRREGERAARIAENFRPTLSVGEVRNAKAVYDEWADIIRRQFGIDK